MTHIFWIDTETFSETPIKHGVYRYAEKAEIMLWAYAFDDGPVSVWDLTQNPEMPEDLYEALYDDSVLIGMHNSNFDRTIIGFCLDYWIPLHRIRDTMIQALTHSLPGALQTLCAVMGVDEADAKDKRGKDLVRFFCMPRPVSSKIRRATRETNPVEWQEFIKYAGSDIRAMRSIAAKMPAWNCQGEELLLWQLDQEINRRGFLVDVDLATKAIAAVDKEQKRLGKEVNWRTGGAIDRATQRDKMLKFILEEYGVDLPDMQKSTIERRLQDENLPPEVKNLLAIRQEAAMSSTSKYAALVRSVSSDGRLRGTSQFCGASRTGRSAGRLFQPENLFRATLPPQEVDNGIAALKSGHADLLIDNVMEVAANAMRGCIIAPKAKKLVIADLSNIEGRFAAWIADEQWKLDAFRKYDAGEGPDLYKLAYARAFNITPDIVTKDQRQIGKVMELMLQFAGGTGAFLTGAETYGIDLDDLARSALPTVPSRIFQDATGFYEWSLKERRTTYGLSRDAFIVCDSLKRMWRSSHPKIVMMWSELQEAFTNCISYDRQNFQAGRITLRRDGAWLRMILPSGRSLCYPSPRISDNRELSYMGINNYSRKWERIKTFSGKLFENLVQAGARDIFASSWIPAERAGYEIVLRCHDELVTEVPELPYYNAENLARIMATNPPWAQGLPLAAAGFETYRYRK